MGFWRFFLPTSIANLSYTHATNNTPTYLRTIKNIVPFENGRERYIRGRSEYYVYIFFQRILHIGHLYIYKPDVCYKDLIHNLKIIKTVKK